jgi:repressor LexA
MRSLTAQQQKILDFIRQTIDTAGFPPTRTEIARALDFRSPNAAESHLRALAKKGVIELLRGAARGIRLKESTGLPLIGRVAAGSPILAEAHVQGRYQLDPALFKPRADYLLKVRGMSMRDAGILDGDMLAVHHTSNVRSGQIVVARLNGEVTVKRLKRQGRAIELVPENPALKPIKVDDSDDLAIEGIAVGLVRSGRVL